MYLFYRSVINVLITALSFYHLVIYGSIENFIHLIEPCAGMTEITSISTISNEKSTQYFNKLMFAVINYLVCVLMKDVH